MLSIRLFHTCLLLTLLVFCQSLVRGQCAYQPGDTQVLFAGGQQNIGFDFFQQSVDICNLSPGESYSISVCSANLNYDLSLAAYTTGGSLMNWTNGCELSFVQLAGDCATIVVGNSGCNLNFAQFFDAGFSCSTCDPNSFSLVTATASNDPDLIRSTFIGQGCFEILNMDLNGPAGSIGVFENGNVLGMPTGVMLATGDVAIVSGPNDDEGGGANIADGSDVDLQMITDDIHDVVKIEFDFIPSADFAEFQYVFASEEYCDYTGSEFNDVFGFFISGPGINGPFTNAAENIALIPGTNTPVTINNVNHQANSSYYIPNVQQDEINSEVSCAGHPAAVSLVETQFDGFTTVLTAQANVQACETYHIKMVIADVTDSGWDSAVFLAANSFNAGGGSTVSGVVPSTGTNQVYEGCADGYFLFERTEDDLSQPLDIVYSISPQSTAIADQDYVALPGSTSIPAGQSSVQVPIVVYEDGNQEGIETIIIEYQIDCGCPGNVSGPLVSATIEVVEAQPLEAVSEDITICEASSFYLEAQAIGGHGDVSVLWPATGEETAAIEISPTESTVIQYILTDACGYSANGFYNLSIADQIEVTIDTMACPGVPVQLGDQAFYAGANFTSISPSLIGDCDSITLITVAPLQNHETLIDSTLCFGESIEIAGVLYAAPTETSLSVLSSEGCDSLIQISLQTYDAISPTQIDTTVCTGTELQIFDSTLLPNTSGSFLLESSTGCDSLVIVSVSETTDAGVTITEQACQGTSIEVLGQSIEAGSSASFDLVATSGCDSTVIVQVVPIDIVPTSMDTSICINTQLDFEGELLDPGSSHSIVYESVDGCDSLLLLNVFALPVHVVEFDTLACDGGTVMIEGQTFTAGSEGAISLLNVFGCDSTVNISVGTAETYSLELDTFACEGTSLFFDGQEIPADSQLALNYQSIFGCDSIVSVQVAAVTSQVAVLDTAVCENSSLVLFGTSLLPGSSQDFVLESQQACDSILTVNVAALPSATATLDTAACEGTSLLINGFTIAAGTSLDMTLPSLAGCDSILSVNVASVSPVTASFDTLACEGGSIVIENQTILAGTSAAILLQASNGCDSLLTVNVGSLAPVYGSFDTLACEGTGIIFQGTEVLAGSSATFAIPASSGCDSLLTVNVASLAPVYGSLDTLACEGSSIVFQGSQIPAGTSASFSLLSSAGCDSIVTVNVVPQSPLSAVMDTVACEGGFVNIAGQGVAAGDSQTLVLTSTAGCDSLLTVNVEMVDVIEQTQFLQACEGSSVDFEGLSIEAGSSEEFSYVSHLGCDSLVTVFVTPIAAFESQFDTLICAGSSLTIEQQQISAGSSTTLNLTSQLGCDSVVTVNIAAIEAVQANLDTFICTGSTLDFQGEQLQIGDSVDFNFEAASGCDSILNLRVYENPIYALQLDTFACTTEGVIINGIGIAAGETEVFNFSTTENCDSILTVYVEEKEIYQDLVLEQACEGQTLSFAGSTVMAGETVVFSFETIYGCDSIITFVAEELQPIEVQVDTSMCAGGLVLIDGTAIAPGDQASLSYNSSLGCDSNVLVVVEEVEVLFAELEISACEGTSADFDGASIPVGEQMDFTYTSILDCDSILTVSVTALPTYEVVVDTQACAGSQIDIEGTLIDAGSIQQLSFQSIDLCDSLVTVNVIAQPAFSSSIDTSICEGQSISWSGQTFDSDTVVNFTLSNQFGCDSIWTFQLITTALDIGYSTEDVSCFGLQDGSITVDFISGGQPPYTYTLNGEIINETDQISNLSEGSYLLDIYDQQDCHVTEEIYIGEPIELTVEAGPNQIIMPGEQAMIEASISDPSASINWSPAINLSCFDCPNPVASPTQTSSYEITVTQEDDCISSDQVTISLLAPLEDSYSIANAFSPNQDGVNDDFGPILQGAIKDYQFMIYDRWGKQLFYSTDPDIRWDGSFQGDLQTLGVYVYYGQWAFDSDSTPIEIKGNVTLVK